MSRRRLSLNGKRSQDLLVRDRNHRIQRKHAFTSSPLVPATEKAIHLGSGDQQVVSLIQFKMSQEACLDIAPSLHVDAPSTPRRDAWRRRRWRPRRRQPGGSRQRRGRECRRRRRPGEGRRTCWLRTHWQAGVGESASPRRPGQHRRVRRRPRRRGRLWPCRRRGLGSRCPKGDRRRGRPGSKGRRWEAWVHQGNLVLRLRRSNRREVAPKRRLVVVGFGCGSRHNRRWNRAADLVGAHGHVTIRRRNSRCRQRIRRQRIRRQRRRGHGRRRQKRNSLRLRMGARISPGPMQRSSGSSRQQRRRLRDRPGAGRTGQRAVIAKRLQ
mmetsp:Transcript_101569/g.326413  ORF Transcript_101569/g.326413 Transcript_101569/m.326413 type:complete len:325 (+) Transcript_101569:835-1809(+)